MAGEWQETTIGEQATLQRGIDITKLQQRAGGVPVISSGGISSYHDTAQAKGPGVILGRKGVVGSVYYVASDYWPHDTTLWVKDFHGNEPRFVYYFFKYMAPQLATMDVGSANPTLNRNHVHPIAISWPPFTEQRAIAHILGTLDDKIELNRRMNEMLEAMARAIFKSWFVDATESGIPKEWTAGTLGDVAENPRRTVDPSEVEPETPYIGLEHMPRRSIALAEWGRAGDVASGKARFNKGEILFGKLRPYFHKVGVVMFDGVCSTDILTVRPKTPEWHAFVLCLLSSTALIDYADACSTGTKMPRVNWTDLARDEVALPPADLAAKFNAHVQPMIDRITANIVESHTLAAIRDALLPKLISGKIRGGSVEKFFTRI